MNAADPALLLKLLFANKALSIQVHPDDAFARSIGLAHGKTEAWYILSATSNAKVAVGLKWRPTTQQLRTSIEDGSIADMVCWHSVRSGDVVFVPAGTIHAIGPGLVIAEVQQRSDATFRLFDFGRQRELHVDYAVTVAYVGPAVTQTASRRLTDARTLLIACPYFVLERIDLVPDSIWQLNASSETWLLGTRWPSAGWPYKPVRRPNGLSGCGHGHRSGWNQQLQRACRLSGHRAQARFVEWAFRADSQLPSSLSGDAIVTRINRLAFIGNSLPRRCGIATFTTHLQQAVAASCPDIDTRIVAMTDQGRTYDYPPTVCFQIEDHKVEDYARAAVFLNAGRFEAVSLQHEFGIFGGAAGGHIMALLSRLTMPIVTTLHTVLATPGDTQRDVFGQITDVSSKVVVMSKKGRDLLRTVYQVPAEKIELIPHGIPDYPFVEPDQAKSLLGFASKAVILTFGLLSPNKGIEVMIDAMPTILKNRPDAVYVILGATHPNLIAQHGEAYRESLMERACELGIADHVVFLNQFVDQPTLLNFISMCDVYVTPYLNEAQMTFRHLVLQLWNGKSDCVDTLLARPGVAR